MSFKTNACQQISFEDNFLTLSERTRKFVQNSWAKGFGEIVFPAINEDRFAPLYSTSKASRPNAPVNAIISALIIKEMLGLTEDELLASIICGDVRFQYALHTTSFTEQPFSDRTFSRFRERLYNHTQETGRDLLHEEMESLAAEFAEYLGLNPSVKRMDSLMVASSSKKMSRLEVLYTCVANMVKVLRKTEGHSVPKKLERYLEEEDLNRTIYHRKSEELGTRLQQVIDDAVTLANSLDDEFLGTTEYQLLKRVMEDQTRPGDGGKAVPRDNKDISAGSLQNPSDQDATYRKKAGKGHTGYVGNIVETVDEENGILISSYDYDNNHHSDSRFCKETIEKLGEQEEKTVLIADGAYASTANEDLAAKNNIELVTTALLGKTPDELQAEFVLDAQGKTLLKCPAGHKPYKSRYSDKTETIRASFNRKTCENCPLRERCGVKLQKKSAYVLVSVKKVKRAESVKKMQTEEYRSLAKIRNGVEGMPSVMRRKYNVDKIPVRGLVRSKIWFSFKIGAINAKRVIKKMMTKPKMALA